MQEARVKQLEQNLKRVGLALRGALQATNEDGLDSLMDGGPYSILLVGQLGPTLELVFRSGQVNQSLDHPLDTWTRTILDPLAKRLGGKALYPFDGPPYYPFQRWAMTAEGLKSSPLGLLAHPRYGLWHHYRGALFVPGVWTLKSPTKGEHPCESCAEKPCMSACPVSAYSEDGFSLDRCMGHLDAVMGEACLNHGCAARRACPIGSLYHYGPVQQRFHMTAFHKSRGILEV